MYSRLPAFVLGFHGCDQKTKDDVLLRGDVLKPSRNAYDWLGNGIYFWEQNPKRAMDFAENAKLHPEYSKHPITNPSVIGAVIDLGNCLNLMDASSIERLIEAYEAYKGRAELTGAAMLINKGKLPDRVLRFLDRAVIETLHDKIESNPRVEPYDTVRALFDEGIEAYSGAGFHKETHIQICVRNLNSIKAFFDPRAKLDKPFTHLADD